MEKLIEAAAAAEASDVSTAAKQPVEAAWTRPKLGCWKRAHARMRIICECIIEAVDAGDGVPPVALAKFVNTVHRHSSGEERGIFRHLRPSAAAALAHTHAVMNATDLSDAENVISFARDLIRHMEIEERIVDGEMELKDAGVGTSDAEEEAGDEEDMFGLRALASIEADLLRTVRPTAA